MSPPIFPLPLLLWDGEGSRSSQLARSGRDQEFARRQQDWVLFLASLPPGVTLGKLLKLCACVSVLVCNRRITTVLSRRLV